MTAGDRHVIGTEHDQVLADTVGTMIGDYTSQLHRLPTLVRDVGTESLLRARHLLLVDPEAEREETYRCVLEAAQAGAAFFKASSVTEKTFTATIGSPVELAALDAGVAGYRISDWLDFLWAAVVCRARHLVGDLIAVPNEVIRPGGGTFPAYLYVWADALRAYFSGCGDVYDGINRAMELTDPEELDSAASEIASCRYLPSMTLLFEIAAGRADGFNAALEKAVELHRRFWTADEERRSHPDGNVDLPSTALAALAHDQGIPVEVASDYLPRHLVEPTWLSRLRPGEGSG